MASLVCLAWSVLQHEFQQALLLSTHCFSLAISVNGFVVNYFTFQTEDINLNGSLTSFQFRFKFCTWKFNICQNALSKTIYYNWVGVLFTCFSLGMQKAIIKPSSLSALGEPQNNFCSLAATKVRFQSPVLEMQNQPPCLFMLIKVLFVLCIFIYTSKTFLLGSLDTYLNSQNSTKLQNSKKKKKISPSHLSKELHKAFSSRDWCLREQVICVKQVIDMLAPGCFPKRSRGENTFLPAATSPPKWTWPRGQHSCRGWQGLRE